MKEANLKELKQFAADVMLMKHKAGELGLLKTMHAFEPATQAVGYEIAEVIEGKRGDIKIRNKDRVKFMKNRAILALKRMNKQ
jgi:hypothetical protein